MGRVVFHEYLDRSAGVVFCGGGRVDAVLPVISSAFAGHADHNRPRGGTGRPAVERAMNRCGLVWWARQTARLDYRRTLDENYVKAIGRPVSSERVDQDLLEFFFELSRCPYTVSRTG